MIDQQDYLSQLQEHISARFQAAADHFSPIHAAVPDFFTPARRLLSGGKRMRALLLVAGMKAADEAADPSSTPALNLAAALEFFQAAALVHDDIIDDSDIRRNGPAAHAAYAQNARPDILENPRVWGRNAAILLGDLLIVMADDAANCAFGALAGRPATTCRHIWREMTQEVAVGQYLDTLISTLPLTATTPQTALTDAQAVVSHKSGRYSVEHPLVLGAAFAGGNTELLSALSMVGGPLGQAFQLRDDVLGVFGDPADTGKPAGDDLREGKRTALIALARSYAEGTDRAFIETHLGDRHADAGTIARLQQILETSGARDAHEKLITRLLEQSQAALQRAPIHDPAAADFISQLAGRLAFRVA